MMRRKVSPENLAAAQAMTRWFESQDIKLGDALVICTVVIISIIDLMGADAADKEKGATITAKNILRKFVGEAHE